ncbi:MAG TPA: heme o synthase [Bacillales bacterium]|nr:heme o synthase [Bacillales bacterium]
MSKSFASASSSNPAAGAAESSSGVEVKTTAGWKDFIEVSKTGIVISNLITTFTGLWLALHFTGQSFFSHLDTVLWTLLGTAFIVAGGCALNNYIDRDIDPVMERTHERPSATGRLSGAQILWYGLLMSALGIAFLLLTGSYVATVCGLAGLFVYVIVYTMWLKRTHSLNTIVGGISGALPPLIGWAAVDPGLGLTAWELFLVMFFWQPPHFLALAMKRVEEYRAAGIPMLPVVAGFEFTKRQINTYLVALVVSSLFLYSLGTVYLIVSALLGIGWIVLGYSSSRFKDDVAWAKAMFVYSLNYLTVLFVLMVIVTLF